LLTGIKRLMIKLMIAVISLLAILPAFAYIEHFPENYPTCINAKAVSNFTDLNQKIVLCPKGHITVSVMPKMQYKNFAMAYNNYCRDIRLKFSTNSANVLIDNWQYFETSKNLSAQQPKGMFTLPNVTTGNNSGVIKITNDSKTSVCLGKQCLYS